MPDIDAEHFREVLGRYPTGVSIVTSMDSTGNPLGMTVGSFTSVSLEPPMVAFLPSRQSSSWRALRESGDRFCVNILHEDQEPTCRAVATRESNKFADIRWSTSPGGHPVLDGAVAWIDCVTEQVHPAGDHDIVVARVESLDVLQPTQPLLFFRGGYGSFTPSSLASGDADLVSQLLLLDRARPMMEELSASADSEVTATVLIGDKLVLAAAVGQCRNASSDTRVGQRLPFVPPLGSCFAAWGSNEVRTRWVDTWSGYVSQAQLAALRRVPETVRRRGHAIALGHEGGASLESLSTRLRDRDPDVSSSQLRAAVLDLLANYNPPLLEDAHVDVRSVIAPVFDHLGGVAFSLTLWGPPRPLSRSELDGRIQQLCGIAERATEAIGGRRPPADRTEESCQH